MRITREMLLKAAQDQAEKRFKPDPQVVAVFLVGSLRQMDESLIGGSGDIDLLVIQKGQPAREREIAKLSNEIHLDILYQAEQDYSRPRTLRADPWRGWAMWDPLLLYEKGKFFEYTQSSLRAGFDDPANQLARARFFATHARETWTSFHFGAEFSPYTYLTAVFNAANGLAALSGPPLPERRFIPRFLQTASANGQTEYIATLTAMLGALEIDPASLRAALPDWDAAFETGAQSGEDARIHTARHKYYRAAIDTALAESQTLAAHWLMLFTWAASARLGGFDTTQAARWNDALRQAGLDETNRDGRLQSMDHFLDTLEALLDEKTAQFGV